MKWIVKGLTLIPLLGGQGLIHCGGVARIVAFAFTLGTRLLGCVLATALVLAIIQRSEGQDIEEQQRCPNSNGNAELGGVISRVWHDQRTHLPTRFPITVGRGHGRTSGAARPLTVRLSGIQWSDLGGGGGIMKHVMEVVEMGHQVFPERHFGGTVVVTNAGLQANVQVQLVVRVIFRPGYLLKAIGLGVYEFGVLWHRLIWIPRNRSHNTWVIKGILGENKMRTKISYSKFVLHTLEYSF